MRSIASTQPVRIVIVAEHPILRDGLRRLLESRSGHYIVGESGNAETAIAMVRDFEPDILVLGAATVGRLSLDTIEQVAALRLAARTIVLTSCLRPDHVVDAIRHGARGVISTHTAAGVLFQAIDTAMHGGIWIGLNPAPGADSASNPRRFARACLRPNAFGLTPREMEILQAVLSGETNKVIADRCSISENTVKRHLLHLFDKVGASNRVELALFAQHHELAQGA